MRHATAPRAIQVPAALAGHADGNSTTPALVILIAAAFALGACGTQAPRSESDTSAPLTPAPASLPPADLASSEASTTADDEPLPALTCGERGGKRKRSAKRDRHHGLPGARGDWHGAAKGCQSPAGLASADGMPRRLPLGSLSRSVRR